jgi:hypothetical protein
MNTKTMVGSLILGLLVGAYCGAQCRRNCKDLHAYGGHGAQSICTEFSSTICVQNPVGGPFPWADVPPNTLDCDFVTSMSIRTYDCDDCDEVCPANSPENREMHAAGDCNYTPKIDETVCGADS